MQKYALAQVETAKQKKEFINFPKTLYKSNKTWICPLDIDVESRFDASKNELMQDGEIVRYLVYDSQNKVVGRIAAFYNNALAKAGAQLEGYPLSGGCGFFEAIDSQQVANILFDTAASWLKSKGFEAMDGPINFGDRDQWWGLLVSGFEYEALYANNYNPEYYVKLFENYGFQNYFNQYTYSRELIAGELSEATYQKLERIKANKDYSFANIENRKLKDVAKDFMYIYNRGWAKFTGVKPMEQEHADSLVKQLKLIIDPRLIIFAYYQGNPVGFYVSLPDLNRVIGSFNGKLNIINKLKLIFNLKIRRKADRIFGLIFGVIPEFQGKGLESGLFEVFEKEMREKKLKYKTMELAWIGDFNPVMMRMVETVVGAKRLKMHTTYRYIFDREMPFLRSPRMGFKKNNK
ncbi:MAG: hypothetical protein R3Y38_03940 [Rikenellaceae bacterium]